MSDKDATVLPGEAGDLYDLYVLLREALGPALKSERAKRSILQEELADRAGLSRGYLSVIERGGENPTLDVIVKLATVLGMRASELIAAAEEVQNR